jgi:5-methylcytosine-specific restriction protein A
MRREFTRSTKIDAFRRAADRCENCGTALCVGKFHFDHRIADGLTGKPTLDNCVVLCVACHSEKTSKLDVPAIAKAKRREARHIGARSRSSRPMPGGRGSRLKKKISGEVVLR